MQLAYSGPKPLISAHGVSYDNNKEDKFVYLGIVAELIMALNHDYIGDKQYTYQPLSKALDEQQILAQIRGQNPQLDEEIAHITTATQDQIKEEIAHARTNHLLNTDEKEALINNITLLRDYRINRAINKTIYYSGLTSLATIIRNKHISHITASVIPKFPHVLHSLQGTLRKLRPSMDSTIDIYEHDGSLTVTLEIQSL